MDVFEAIRTILAVRSYADRPIPREVLLRILEAGRLSASAENAQPWHFILIQNRDMLRRLGAVTGAGPHSPESLASIRAWGIPLQRIGAGPYIADAQAAIVVVTDRTIFGFSDGSRAIQNMLLAAWAEGVGGNWVGFGGGGLDPLKPVFGIPDELDVMGVLPLGYPSKPVGQGKKKRKPLADVAFGEMWGQPL